jgi:hypothetical protein
VHLRKRSEGLIVQEADDEVLLLDEAGGRIHQLNSTAAFIWRMCEQSSLQDMGKALVDRYDVEEAAALEDVRRTLAALTTLGLLQQV